MTERNKTYRRDDYTQQEWDAIFNNGTDEGLLEEQRLRHASIAEKFPSTSRGIVPLTDINSGRKVDTDDRWKTEGKQY